MKLSEKLTEMLEQKLGCKIESIQSNGRVSATLRSQGQFSWFAYPSIGKPIGSVYTMKECVEHFGSWVLVGQDERYSPDVEIVFTPSKRSQQVVCVTYNPCESREGKQTCDF